jgi:hypothetical protein
MNNLTTFLLLFSSSDSGTPTPPSPLGVTFLEGMATATTGLGGGLDGAVNTSGVNGVSGRVASTAGLTGTVHWPPGSGVGA